MLAAIKPVIWIGLILSLGAGFVLVYKTGRDSGALETEAYYQKSMDEVVTAFQSELVKARTESRERIAKSDLNTELKRRKSHEQKQKLLSQRVTADNLGSPVHPDVVDYIYGPKLMHEQSGR